MRFALLGNHIDGLEMTSALVASGRHELICFAVTTLDPIHRRRWPENARQVHDLEEILADPAVELVVVASGPANRPAHLRRALQSERHVVCVHPADQTPEIAYEAGMIQQDTRHALLPLLPAAFHPAFLRLKEFLGGHPALGVFRLLEVERWTTGAVLLNADSSDQKPSVPGWDVLRALGGQVAEVAALAPAEELTADVPVLLVGRFEQLGMFQATFVPNQPEERWRLRLVGSAGQVELLFPLGTPGPAFLSWREGGELREESWDAWDPWPTMVEIVEEAVAETHRQGPRSRTPTGRLSWQDEIRCQELDDAARRSVARRRSSLLEYPEASEEVSFKGTMTLLGCGLLWTIIFLAILSRPFPWLGWAVVPLLAIFLGMQLLRWVIPPKVE